MNEKEKYLKVLSRQYPTVDSVIAEIVNLKAIINLPKGTEQEKARRTAAIQEATLYAAQVPLRTMEAALKALPLALEMAQKGNPASASDAGVAALAAVAAIRGARINVRINCAGLQDKSLAQPLLERADAIVTEAIALESQILTAVDKNIE